ncbi:hypothetical protein E2C01_047314 [Portunus trituberculatus]|uniref:Uncharacterized protein n=1 Tax=Portunus trituberculatus TaxID=210409 RepID=A0A5B7GA54_PORTR|nr:hypothetical protein [Portunus trituberculatus]
MSPPSGLQASVSLHSCLWVTPRSAFLMGALPGWCTPCARLLPSYCRGFIEAEVGGGRSGENEIKRGGNDS